MSQFTKQEREMLLCILHQHMDDMIKKNNEPHKLESSKKMLRSIKQRLRELRKQKG